MLLDVLELVVGQRPLLVEHFLADPDLADVVQPAGGAHPLDLLVVEPHLGGDGGGEVGDARRVAAEVGVLRLERVDQGLERGHRDPLQVGPLGPHLGGAGRDLLLEPAADLLVLDPVLAAAERAGDGAAQHVEVDRLGEVVERAALHAERGGGGVVHGGEHEDRHVRLGVDDPGDEVDAAGPGQVHVEEHAGDLAAAEHLERLLAGGRDRHFVPAPGQVLLQGIADAVLVIDDEHRHRSIGQCHGRAPIPGVLLVKG